MQEQGHRERQGQTDRDMDGWWDREKTQRNKIRTYRDTVTVTDTGVGTVMEGQKWGDMDRDRDRLTGTEGRRHGTGDHNRERDRGTGTEKQQQDSNWERDGKIETRGRGK